MGCIFRRSRKQGQIRGMKIGHALGARLSGERYCYGKDRNEGFHAVSKL
jgi:hypothetical protein